MVFNEPNIITICLAGKAAPSRYIQYWIYFWKFGGNCAVALPLIAGSAGKTCQHHLETRAASVWNFVQSDQ